MLASLIAAVVIAQAAPDSAWQWRWADVFGQKIQVWAKVDGDYVRWDDDQAADYVAPAEAARRKRIAEPRPLNYGVAADKLAADAEMVRASDPETLRMFAQAADEVDARKPKPCPGPDCPADEPVEKKQPSLAEWLKIGVEDVVMVGVGVALVLAGGVLALAAYFNSRSGPNPPVQP